MNKKRLKLRLIFMALGACLVSRGFGLSEMHPGFTTRNLLPTELNSITGISSLDLFPNGDAALCSWGGSQKSNGELWIVPDLATGKPGKPYRIATGLREPLGIKVIAGNIFVMEKPRLLKFEGKDSSWTGVPIFTLPSAWYNDKAFTQFSMGLEFKDSAFWFTTGTSFVYDPEDRMQRGAFLRVPYAGGTASIFARGLNAPNGLFIGPDQEFFTTDNQGFYKPTNALYWLPSRVPADSGPFFGFRTRFNNACSIQTQIVGGEICPSDPEIKPAIWIPYASVSNSPSRPVLLRQGRFAGQMISGDVNHGGMLRFQLERVGEQYQGAVFPMMKGDATGMKGGIPFGIQQIQVLDSGNMVVAGIGGGVCNLGGSGDWNFMGACRGLHWMTPTDSIPFEIEKVNVESDGFSLTFTQPAGNRADSLASYSVKSTVFTPVQAFGMDASSADNNIQVPVSSVRLDTDGRKVRLRLASLLPGRMYAITLNNITSRLGDSLYNASAFYTVNQLPQTVETRKAPQSFQVDGEKVTLTPTQIRIPGNRSFHLRICNLQGRCLGENRSNRGGTFPLPRLQPGVYVLTGFIGTDAIHQCVSILE